MAANCASILIVARPGPLRDALRALMTAMPQIDGVGEADDVAAALGRGREARPAMVLLDSSLTGEGIWLAVRRIKAKWPQIRCIFFADSVQQQYEAETAGADAVLLKGVLPAKLIATIVRLLPQQAKQEEKNEVAVSRRRFKARTQQFRRQHGATR
jgi:DNA-binding NarL/FixJ family response regulator